MNAQRIKELALFALSLAKEVGANAPAFQKLAKRVGSVVGGATEAELNAALDEAVRGRKEAGKAMHEAGKFKE